MFRVDDVQTFQEYVLHLGVLSCGSVRTGDAATLKPDQVLSALVGTDLLSEVSTYILSGCGFKRSCTKLSRIEV